MIIIDLQQIMLANLFVSLKNYTNDELNEDFLRHMVLNTIRSYKQKFRSDFGDTIVIAAEGKDIWRKDVFPFYKANRKKIRDGSNLDWNMIFKSLHKIRDEIKESFPYPVIQHDKCEADDVIAVLCEHFGNLTEPDEDDIFNIISDSRPNDEDILILSSDEDFVQLHQYTNVKQYNPIKKKFISHISPSRHLKEKIIRGDSGDGVPNILSPDNTFVAGERQRKLSTKKLEEWLTQDPAMFCTGEMLRNYKRNEQLIDLDFIPSNLKEEIIKEYESQANKNRSKLFNYFIEHKLKNLMQSINEF
jgi:hypothetical protein